MLVLWYVRRMCEQQIEQNTAARVKVLVVLSVFSWADCKPEAADVT